MAKNPYELWQRYHIEDLQSFGIFDLYRKDNNPQTGGFDTETTGLHIKKDKPFLVQFGWLIPKKDYGRVFTFYPTPENMKIYFDVCKLFKYNVAHNIKFDLHMLSNIGYAAEVQAMTNLCENMAVARLAFEAIPARNGGDTLKLKKIGEKYVHSEAGKSEHLLNEDLERLNGERVKILTAALRQFDHPTEKVYKPIRLDKGTVTTLTYVKDNPDNVEWKWVPKKWGKKLVEDFLKDPTTDVEDLPDDVREVWLDWQEEYPEPTYEDIDRPLMIKYGGEDIITMLEFFKRAYKIVKDRDQLHILKLENDCILPVYRMERVGLKTDMKYLRESRAKVKAYITKLRQEMYGIFGERINVGQHEKIIKFFDSKWNIQLSNADSPTMKRIIGNKLTKEIDVYNFEGTFTGTEKVKVDVPKDAQRLAYLIKSLRSLEKWYSTYINRIIDNASYDGRIYSQINLNGAISGRMSCDVQQFPKKALKDEDGNELFHPRKAFVPKGEDYESIVYIDYDQIELVTQAHYTLLVSGGDPNLCRAYMPFRCRHYRTDEYYDYKSDTDRARWDELRNDFTWDKLKEQKEEKEHLDTATAIKYGWSAWLDEQGNPWVRTDVHAQTTHNTLTELGYICYKEGEHYELPATHIGVDAFPRIIDSKKLFDEVRSKGKLFNFMANYGGGKTAAMKQLDLGDREADALVKGYNVSYPHVVIYQRKIVHKHSLNGYVHNHFGRRYYLSYSRMAYKLANYVVQGTCADALKKAIIELDAYLMDKKTNMVIPIHDEIQFDKAKGEDEVIENCLKIMQKAFDWCLVPVTAGVEYTTTNWSEKQAA